MKKIKNLVNAKLTTKEEKAIVDVLGFLQHIKDTSPSKRKDLMLEYAFQVRQFLNLGVVEPKDIPMVLSSNIIQLLIPYLYIFLFDDTKSLEEVMKLYDEQTDAMFKNMIEQFNEQKENELKEKIKENESENSDNDEK